MRQQKYFTEVALGLCSEGAAMLRSSDIIRVRADPNTPSHVKSSHIYAIGKRPRVSLKPKSIHHDTEYVLGVTQLSVVATFLELYLVERTSASYYILYKGFQLRNSYVYGEVCRHNNGEVEFREFKLPRQMFQPQATNFGVYKYPHNKLLALTSTGEIVHELPVVLFVPHMLGVFNTWADIEIVYVGQAYGKTGERSALDRLKDHSTLQKIQADVLANEPDMEVVVLLFNYEDPLLFSIHDGTGKPKVTGKQDEDHFLRILRTRIRGNDITTLAEAGLIRYFQPYYNSVYKDSFPSTDLKSLQQCYDLDLLALSVELNTEDLYLNTYSQNTKKLDHHIARYDLHSDADRRRFFCVEDLSST